MDSKPLVAAIALALAACAPATGVSAPGPAVATDTASLPLSIHWTRSSAEHDAVFLQVYRSAGERLEMLARGRAAGTWAVILDADETVLDNSTYQKERAEARLGFTSETWNAWVRRVEAGALPGAAAFIARAGALGGRVVIVTNRDEEVCDDTRRNFVALDIAVDAVLCRPPSSGEKNPRFHAVAEGTAAGLPPLDVLLWIGDNIQDFPALTQEIRTRGDATYDEFGRMYFILPNPMYGSWEGNPSS
ncbi:MAG: HAD family acid phosphatase [Longimicrobiales bacterium]